MERHEVQLVRGKGRFQPWHLLLVNVLNGEVVATSEGYFSKWNAKRAARKNLSPYPLVDKTDKPYRKFGGL